MSNLAIEILCFTFFLIILGTILTFNVYENSRKELQRKIIFCSQSISNPYCDVR